jgi:8-oxo-dGTP pyrophosphatase MutT (NUDIX family)
MSDLTKHYKGRDLHKEGVWGSGLGSKAYGGILFNSKGQVLIRKPSGHYGGYHWTFAKGRPDGNEHPTETALREVEQETGHSAKIVGSVPGGFSGDTTTTHFYLMHSNGHDAKKMDNETSETKWVHPKEAVGFLNQSATKAGRARDLKILNASLKAYNKLSKFSESLSSRFGVLVDEVLSGDSPAGAVSRLIEESQSSWKKPDSKSIQHEYDIEYTHHAKHHYGHIFPTVGHFKRAIDASPVVKVTPDMDSKIGYRSHTKDFDSLHSLISGYASYPEFRNKDTLTSLNHRIKNGHPTDMPIVFKHSNGSLRVFSGNTRMDIAKHHGIHPEVVVVDLPKHVSPEHKNSV